MPEFFNERLAQQGITLSAVQTAQFSRYYELLIEYNQKINLTAITDETEVYLKHFYDSLLPALVFPLPKKLGDVGAGAGFPSIPLKIVYPELDVTIVEPLKKRIRFLEILTQELGLKVTLINERAEVYAQQTRENFPLVTARAVANLPVLLELCAPLVQLDGYLLAYKGQAVKQEVKQATRASQLLGLKLQEVYEQVLNPEIIRYNVIYRKVKPTPLKYPRNFAQIKHQPLI